MYLKVKAETRKTGETSEVVEVLFRGIAHINASYIRGSKYNESAGEIEINNGSDIFYIKASLEDYENMLKSVGQEIRVFGELENELPAETETYKTSNKITELTD